MTPVATLALLPALFAPQPGWHVGNQTARACPGVSASRCAQASSWAATIPWRGCGFCIPHQTLAALAPDGTILEIQVATERPPVAAAGSGRRRSAPVTSAASKECGGEMGSTNASHGTAVSRRTCSRSSVACIQPRRRLPPRTQNSQQCGCTSEVRRTVTFRLLLTLLLLATPTAAGGASAGNPWQLRCPSMPEEQAAPTPLQAVALRFFPWIRPAAKALQAGPIYLVALSSDTAIARDGDAARQRRLLPPPRPDRRRTQLPRRGCDPRPPPRHPRPTHDTRVLPQRCQRLHRQVAGRHLPAAATRVHSLRSASLHHRAGGSYRPKSASAAPAASNSPPPDRTCMRSCPSPSPAPTTAPPAGDQSHPGTHLLNRERSR